MAPKELLAKPHPDVVCILVGPDQREFVVHRKLLCESSSFFRDSVDAVPEGLTSPSSSPSSKSTSSNIAASRTPVTIWLASESAGVFELFVLWLYRRHGFRTIIDEAAAILISRAGNERIVLAPETSPSTTGKASVSPAVQACTTLHWNLVQLHLFAALTGIPALQDAAMDAIQDLYLRFDWETTPGLVRFLYAECDSYTACRLRKWAVALLAWTLSNRDSGSAAASIEEEEEAVKSGFLAIEDDDAAFLRLLNELPALRADYDAHLAKMQVSRADVRIKNPQLRIQSNHLRRSDRNFGFRQCSFHSHRRSVGEGRCPHMAPAHGRSDSDSSNLSGHSEHGAEHGYRHGHGHGHRHMRSHSGHGGHHKHSESIGSRMSAAITPPLAAMPTVYVKTTPTKTTTKTAPVPATGRSTPTNRWGVQPSLRSSPVRSPTPSRRAPDMAPLGMECTI